MQQTTCPQCRQLLRFAPESAGQVITCPTCREEIPSSSGFASSPPAPFPPVTDKPAATQQALPDLQAEQLAKIFRSLDVMHTMQRRLLIKIGGTLRAILGVLLMSLAATIGSAASYGNALAWVSLIAGTCGFAITIVGLVDLATGK